MATLKQVAAQAGVHLTTAAAVLNGSAGNTRVSEETRKRVKAAAAQLGYFPNELARRLRTGTSNVVAFLGGDLRNPFFAELASELESELQKREMQLMISHVSGQSMQLAERLRSLRQQAVTKVILWDESSAARLPETDLQLLPVGFTVKVRPGLWLDLKHAISLSVSELVRRGFKRVGFFAPRGHRESPSVDIRQAMFVAECRRQGLAAPKCYSFEGESWSVEAAARGAASFMRRVRVDAFLGFNDVAALGLLVVGASLPRPPFVIGFDGTSWIRSWPGSPVYLDLGIPELARRAVEAIATDGRSSAHEWLRPTLHGGGSAR